MNYLKLAVLAGLVTGLAGMPIGVAVSQTVEQRQDQAHRLYLQSTEQFKANQFEAALQSVQQALAIYRDIKDQRSEQVMLNLLGIAYTYRDQYPAAIQALEQSLAIAHARQDGIGEVDALINLASARLAAGDYTQSIGDNTKALAIATKIKNRLGEARALSGLGADYSFLGNYAKSIDYHGRALAVHREIKDQTGEAKALNSLGAAYTVLGNYPKAISYYQQSLALKRAIHDRLGEGVTLGNIGYVYQNLRDYAKAIDYNQQSLAVARELKFRSLEGAGLARLGQSYQSLGDIAKAIEYSQQSLAIARDIKNRLGEAFALGNLGAAYQFMGQHPKAIEYGQQSLAIARETKNSLAEAKLLTGLAVSWVELGQLDQAEPALRSAIAIWETQRIGLTDQDKVALTESQAETYQLLQRVLVQQNRTDAALEIAEKGRARAFAELLAARGNTLSPAPDLATIRRIAKAQKATLVEYSIINSALLYIWVIKPTGEITFRTQALDPKTPIQQLVSNSRNALGVRGRGIAKIAASPSVTADLGKMYQLLIAPIGADLPKDPADRVIFLPQGALFLVPFVALQDPQNKYLIERYAIVTAPSIQTLDLTRARASRRPNAVVVGDPTMPVFGNTQLPALPGARQEAIDIAKILQTQPLLGAQATKAAVLQQMQTATIVHLATHGILDTVSGGIPGAVALAPSGQDNGLLTSGEIFDLKLTVDLVVLSACDTGRGEITGDGVMGLSRSLIAAGAPSVVVSLWAVNDRSTSLLMSDFYRQLQTNPNKAQALRQSMLTTMKQYPNPSDWAAFTLVGESD
jgi:CHAT domain-containing protein/Flp pilus assembly protein TadD